MPVRFSVHSRLAFGPGYGFFQIQIAELLGRKQPSVMTVIDKYAYDNAR